MGSVVVSVDSKAYEGRSKAREEAKKNKHYAEKIMRLISVDAEGFCESQDWPYLWSGQHRKNRKKP